AQGGHLYGGRLGGIPAVRRSRVQRGAGGVRALVGHGLSLPAAACGAGLVSDGPLDEFRAGTCAASVGLRDGAAFPAPGGTPFALPADALLPASPGAPAGAPRAAFFGASRCPASDAPPPVAASASAE